ncbi:MAG: TCR/Tet family MFS transporter [Paracoccaceae bacterium]
MTKEVSQGKAASATNRLSLIFILVTVMIDAMGIGLIIPVMPDLLQEVQGAGIANAALWGGVLSTTFAVMQFLFAPVLGGLSDRYGRRPVLLISTAIMAIDYLVMAVAGSIWLLLFGRVVGGITAATQSTASAYMADISAPKDKAKNFGLIGAAFGMGFVLGPLVGGVLGELGTRAPFYAAAVLAALNAMLGWMVLQETVTERLRRPFTLSRANPLGSLRVFRAMPTVGGLIAVYFIYQLAFMVYPAIWSFWGQERLGWSPSTIGLSLALFGIMMAVVQGGLIRYVLQWLGDRGTVIYGHVFDLIVFLVLATVTSGTVALILTPVAAIAAVISPALTGLMSQAVRDDQQGELQGALTSVGSLAAIFGYAVYPFIFAIFAQKEEVEAATLNVALPYFPGAPYILSAVLVGVGLLLFTRVHRPNAT